LPKKEKFIVLFIGKKRDSPYLIRKEDPGGGGYLSFQSLFRQMRTNAPTFLPPASLPPTG
jgi:hypothetical protein